MSLGASLGAFADSFAASRDGVRDRKEREANAARQDRWLDMLEKNPGMLQGLGGGGGGMGAAQAAGGAAAPASMPTGTTADYVRAGLVKRGMAEHIADGWNLNFKDESAFNTSALGDGGNAFGLAQWNGPRMKALNAYAAQRGVAASDPDLQMDYLMHELQGPEAGAWAKIQKATTPGQAAAAILNHFERPAESHRARREKSYLAYDNRLPAMGATAPAY